MFRIPVNTSELTLIAGGPAEPVLKDRSTGELAKDRDTGRTMFQLHLMVLVPGDARPQVWPVKVAGEPPAIKQGQAVQVSGLVAADWENGGRHGTSFRAETVAPVGAQAKAAA
jgi:hypothetical protein